MICLNVNSTLLCKPASVANKTTAVKVNAYAILSIDAQ